MNYQFNDNEWKIIIDTFDIVHNSLDPLSRMNISNLIMSISKTRIITNTDQANMIIALLIANCKTKIKNNCTDNNLLDQNLVKKQNNEFPNIVFTNIYEIIENLRIFVARIREEDITKQCIRNRG